MLCRFNYRVGLNLKGGRRSRLARQRSFKGIER
jgi:hypothetical protein